MSMFRNLIICMTPFLLSCGFYPSVPMAKLEYKSSEKPKDILVVLLRGFGGRISYFEDNGWIEAASAASTYADFVAPDAHYGYFANKTFIERLREDVIKPAMQKGYKEIWLAGISMGGMGSILYSNTYPNDISRLYLFAPYLGDGKVQEEIRVSGGLQKWQCDLENIQNWQYSLWLRLQDIVTDPERRVKLFIGFGDRDKLDGHDLLARHLPSNYHVKIPGGHKDTVFRELWGIILERGLLNRTISNP